MSFQIKLQRTSSVNNKIGKNITNVLTVSGTLKDETSILTPVVLIESNSPTDLFTCNYASIPTFGRKYFITDIRSIYANMVEVHMKVDVLETYKDEIKDLNCIIRRTADTRYTNIYLDDGVFNVYQNPNITPTLFPSGFNRSEECIILAVAGSV
jgi:hypothetical protein